MSPRTRQVVLAIAAGLALADASIVTLALPEVLVELDTSVEGVAAVIGIYALVLAGALVPIERAQRTHGAAKVGAAGMVVFGLASLVCGLAGSVVLLLIGRAVQAVGGAAALIAVFALLEDGHGADKAHTRKLWLGAAVLSSAIGPALGGALTQAFDWRAIFLFQTPVAVAAAWVCWTTTARPAEVLAADDDAPGPRWTAPPTIALAMVSAALTAVLFLLVLLLVAGWSVDPLRAALTVSVLPAAALVGSRIGGDATHRAATGSLLIGAGTLALAFLPDDQLLWTVPPQVLAGLGMGLALPALGGELLPERTSKDAAWLLTTRHVGIFAIIAALGSITATRLEDATQRARERGVAVALDAKLPPTQKVSLAPALLGSVDAADPRGALLEALDRERERVEQENLAEYDRMASQVDETLIAAVGESFDVAFLVTGGLAVLAALVLAPKAPPPSVRTGALVGASLLLTVAAPAVYAREQDDRRPPPIVLQDPCNPQRELPGSGGISGFVQDRALQALDTSACDLGSSREELVLALADPEDADRFEERHGQRPSAGGIITSLLFGG